ncbi:MAG: hypothetical protein IK036_05110 [Clostridia bacterium]|nr:hypothetical protein [Clostridia bacterium]
MFPACRVITCHIAALKSLYNLLCQKFISLYNVRIHKIPPEIKS